MYEVVSHYSVIYISLMISDVETFSCAYMNIGHSYIFFGNMSIQVLCPFLKLVVGSFVVEFEEFSIYSGH